MLQQPGHSAMLQKKEGVQEPANRRALKPGKPVDVHAQGVQRPFRYRPLKKHGLVFYGLLTGCLRPLTKGLSCSGRGSSGIGKKGVLLAGRRAREPTPKGHKGTGCLGRGPPTPKRRDVTKFGVRNEPRVLFARIHAFVLATQ